MTPDERRAIEARLEAAQRQPWIAEGFPPPADLKRPPGELWWDVMGPADAPGSERYGVSDDMDRPTAEFIAHAPADIRALLAALDAADARALRLERAIEDFLAAESSDAASGGEMWYAPVVYEAAQALRAALEETKHG